jgi:hypothetical protein
VGELKQGAVRPFLELFSVEALSARGIEFVRN